MSYPKLNVSGVQDQLLASFVSLEVEKQIEARPKSTDDNDLRYRWIARCVESTGFSRTDGIYRIGSGAEVQGYLDCLSHSNNRIGIYASGDFGNNNGNWEVVRDSLLPTQEPGAEWYTQQTTFQTVSKWKDYNWDARTNAGIDVLALEDWRYPTLGGLDAEMEVRPKKDNTNQEEYRWMLRADLYDEFQGLKSIETIEAGQDRHSSLRVVFDNGTTAGIGDAINVTSGFADGQSQFDLVYARLAAKHPAGNIYVRTRSYVTWSDWGDVNWK